MHIVIQISFDLFYIYVDWHKIIGENSEMDISNSRFMLLKLISEFKKEKEKEKQNITCWNFKNRTFWNGMHEKKNHKYGNVCYYFSFCFLYSRMIKTCLKVYSEKSSIICRAPNPLWLSLLLKYFTYLRKVNNWIK